MGGKKIKILLSVLIPVLIFGYLALQGFKDSAAYYYTISEVAAKEMNHTGKIRIKGELAENSVDYDPRLPLLEFTLKEGGHTLPAVYRGVLPDNFHHAEEVIVEGKMESDGKFIVSKLMLQCPSKYEGED
ncbi:MAG TPA: cytochrome c maturation protein CcmE [Firmicutes bacterium]|nr:cytochrome c maturation protein CcmE [Bacillota bacterium]